MKRNALVTILLALCLCLCLVFVSCDGNTPSGESNNNGGNNNAGENQGGNSEHTHSYGEWEITKVATCLEKGEQQKTCSCGDVVKEDVAETGHNFENNICTACGQKDKLGYVREGNKIYFGSYPQSKVTDDALVATLNELAGALPEQYNPGAWTDYGYYEKEAKKEYMWYIDVEENGERYRGVYFTQYRPGYIKDASAENTSSQDNNGYNEDTVYWFKYEPISWTILKEDSGKAFLACDIVLDAQAYQTDTYLEKNNSYVVGKDCYANNYAESTIRAWLNDSFYNTAFGELEKSIISLTTVANGLESTGSSYNRYLCNDTEDKVFLPSVQEVSTLFANDQERARQSTDYAKAQGAMANASEELLGAAQWWLRSPHTKDSVGMCYVDWDGGLDNSYQYGIRYTYRGVIPALWIEL